MIWSINITNYIMYIIWSSIFVIAGWGVTYVLSLKKSARDKKREVITEYLINAWRTLESASNRSDISYKAQFGLRSPPFYSDYSPQRFFRPCFRPKIYCFTQVNLEKRELFHFCFSLHLKLHIDRGFCIVESISRHSCQKVDNKV